MDLSESEVQQLLDLLLRKHFLRTLSGFGNRVVKYEQRFCNSEFGQLKLSPAELAVIATLLLRGAQTPGELRTRINRMHEFSDVSEVEQVLQQLATREDGPFVVRPAREPGKRESRFMHLFSGQIDEAPAALESEDDGDLSAGISALENEVSELKRLVQHLLARKRMTKLRVGVVGLGSIAQKAYLPILGRAADWTLVGGFSPNQQKRSRCATATAWPVSPVWTARPNSATRSLSTAAPPAIFP